MTTSASLRAAGYHVDNCLIDFGEAGADKARQWLEANRYDAVAHRRRRATGREQHAAIRIGRQCRTTQRSPVAASSSIGGRGHPRRHPPLVSDPRRWHDDTHAVDVLVVGAGPTGLTSPVDLARAGRSVTILDALAPRSTRRAARSPPCRARSRFSMPARLADDLRAQRAQAPGVTIFGGARIDPTHLDSPYRFIMIAPQANVDDALADYAVAQGCRYPARPRGSSDSIRMAIGVTP